MNQLRKLIDALSLRQKITIGVAAILVIAGMFALTHWHTESDFKALYTSLSPEDAAAVIQKLKESGIEYRVSDSGSSVSAPSARVAELRLDLAAAGIPKSGRVGYELFDKTNFGATEFTEHLNYHRALEGELERSIAALSSVEMARVHLTFPKESVFLDSRQPGKASVLLKIRVGARLSPQNVAAITNLVASAVEGLAPEAVSVLDMRGNLLNRPRHDLEGGDEPSDSVLDYRQKIENDLLTKINATLEPLLGPEKFHAGVSVECDLTSGEQSEETLDPTKSVMTTSVKSEEQTGSNLASGQPGTASTLPRPTSRPGSSSSGLSRRMENLAFQTSRMVRHTRTPQGSIKKISVSILLDQLISTHGQGPKAKRVLSAPTTETVTSIHDLVSAAAGLSTERGDRLVIESLPFQATLNFEPSEPTPTATDSRVPRILSPYIKDFSTLLLAGGALALLLCVAVAGGFFMIRKKKKTSATAAHAIEPGSGKRPIPLAGESIEAQRMEQARLESESQAESQAQLRSSPNVSIATLKKSDVLLQRLRESAAKDSAVTANLLRAWMSDAEQQIR